MRKKEENLNTASGLRIAMILLGIAVTPVLLSSSSLGNQLSSGSLISVVLLGGVILTLLSAITISVGEKARLPTYGIVKPRFYVSTSKSIIKALINMHSFEIQLSPIG